LVNHLRNFTPETSIIPARKRGTAYSPNDPKIANPILFSNLVFLGPGSPTYAARQLRDTLTWQYLLARHRLGAGLALASAAAIAAGSHVLPVYEIYKVGEDLHWKPGLDLFAYYGLSLIFIPHWNNNDGGSELDTNRCYIGRDRFNTLLEMLPPGQVVVGVDEQTGLAIDFDKRICMIVGSGRVVLIQEGERIVMEDPFSIEELGPFKLPDPDDGIVPDIWQKALSVERFRSDGMPEPPQEILSLVEQRQKAREAKIWDKADLLRRKIEALGWYVQDTAQGPLVSKK
jgi:hypothetical protein